MVFYYSGGSLLLASKIFIYKGIATRDKGKE